MPLTAAVATLLVTACGTQLPTRAELAERVEIRELSLPEEVRQNQRAVEGVSVAEARDGARAVVAATDLPVDAPAGVAVWRTGEFGEIYGVQGLPEVEGDVESVAVDQNDGTAVLVGTRWTGSARAPFLWTSTSPTTWTPMDLGPDVPPGGLVAVAVEGGTAWALNRGYESRLDVLTVDLATGTWTATTLPEPGEGLRRTWSALCVRDGRVVVLGHEGAPGSPLVPVSFVSTDGGTTFAGPHPIGDGRPGTSASGLVETPDGFVVTGGTGDTSREAEPVLWRSPDGVTWTQEPVTVQQTIWEGEVPEVSVGNPKSEEDGTVSVTLTARDGGRWAVGTRLDGDWYSGSQAESFDPGGALIRTESTDYVFVGWGAGRLASWGYFGFGDYSERAAVPGSRPRWLTVPDRNSGGRLLAQSAVWEAGEEYSRSDVVSTDMVREGDAVVAREWRPSGADGWRGLVSSSAGATEVVVGHLTDNSGWRTEALVSQDSGATWAAAEGIDSDTDLLPEVVRSVDDVFHLVAEEGVRDIGNTERRPVLWTSRDGRTWARLDQDIAIDGESGSVRDVCALPAGGVVLVGSTRNAEDRWVPATWVVEDGTWSGHAHSDLGDGSFSSCAARKKDMVVVGNASGGDRTWRTTDGAAVEEESVLAEGVSRGAPLALGAANRPDGWVAPGYLDTAEHVGPILWFSTDARSWEWLPLPGPALTGRPTIALDGADLVVTARADLVPRAWVVPDVASVF